MFVLVAVLAVIAQAPVQPDCAAGASDPLGFVSSIMHGRGPAGMDGTITDPPAPKGPRTVVGSSTPPMMRDILSSTPHAKTTPADPDQQAHDEAAGICNVKQPA